MANQQNSWERYRDSQRPPLERFALKYGVWCFFAVLIIVVLVGVATQPMPDNPNNLEFIRHDTGLTGPSNVYKDKQTGQMWRQLPSGRWQQTDN